MNMSNNCYLAGRPAQDAAIYTNKDGSRRWTVDLIVPRTYTSADGYNTDRIRVEGFVNKAKAGKNCVADYIKKGRLVGFQCELKQESWKDKDGKINYRMKIQVNQVDLKDNKKQSAQAEEAVQEMAPMTDAAPVQAESDVAIF